MRTYRALKKNSNHVAVGRKGRKNCRVIGMRSDIMSIVAAKVLVSGPGAWLIDSEKTATMIRIK